VDAARLFVERPQANAHVAERCQRLPGPGCDQRRQHDKRRIGEVPVSHSLRQGLAPILKFHLECQHHGSRRFGAQTQPHTLLGTGRLAPAHPDKIRNSEAADREFAPRRVGSQRLTSSRQRITNIGIPRGCHRIHLPAAARDTRRQVPPWIGAVEPHRGWTGLPSRSRPAGTG
jgi:hypothetical protein